MEWGENWIDQKYYLVRKFVEEGNEILGNVNTYDNMTDQCIKPHTKKAFFFNASCDLNEYLFLQYDMDWNIEAEVRDNCAVCLNMYTYLNWYYMKNIS